MGATWFKCAKACNQVLTMGNSTFCRIDVFRFEFPVSKFERWAARERKGDTTDYSVQDERLRVAMRHCDPIYYSGPNKCQVGLGKDVDPPVFDGSRLILLFNLRHSAIIGGTEHAFIHIHCFDRD